MPRAALFLSLFWFWLDFLFCFVNAFTVVLGDRFFFNLALSVSHRTGILYSLWISASASENLLFALRKSSLFSKFDARLPVTKRVNEVRNIAFYRIILQNYVQYRVGSPKTRKYKNLYFHCVWRYCFETLKTTERLIHDFRVHRHILLCICLVPTWELDVTGVTDLFFESVSDLTSMPPDRSCGQISSLSITGEK